MAPSDLYSRSGILASPTTIRRTPLKPRRHETPDIVMLSHMCDIHTLRIRSRARNLHIFDHTSGEAGSWTPPLRDEQRLSFYRECRENRLNSTRAGAKVGNNLDRIHNIAADHEKCYPTAWQALYLL